MSWRAGAERRAELRFATAAVAAVRQHDPVLEIETGQLRLHRLADEGLESEPAVRDIRRQDGARRDRVSGAGPVDRPRLWTLRVERARDARFVPDLHQEGAPAALHQSRGRGTALGRDAALRIDAHDEQALRVEDALNLRDRARLVAQVRRRVEPRSIGVAERLAEVRHRLDEATHLGHERLQIGVRAARERRHGHHQQSAAERMREERGLKDRTDGVAACDVAPAVC